VTKVDRIDAIDSGNKAHERIDRRLHHAFDTRLRMRFAQSFKHRQQHDVVANVRGDVHDEEVVLPASTAARQNSQQSRCAYS
jgi:hypothetical protein